MIAKGRLRIITQMHMSRQGRAGRIVGTYRMEKGTVILFQVPMYSRCWVAPVYVYPVFARIYASKKNIHSYPRRRRTTIDRIPRPGQSRSKLRVPSRPIRRLERLLAAVPEEGAQLEPLLAAAGRVHGALVAEVDVLADGEALGVLVRQDGGPAGFWLAHHVGRPRVVQEAVVDAARIPGVDAARPAERGVAYQGVAASVVMACVVVSAEVVLLWCGVLEYL